MKKTENTCIFILFLILLGQTFVSCKDDENEDEYEDALIQAIDNLPSMQDIKSTTAFLPFDKKYRYRNIELEVNIEDKFIMSSYMILCYTMSEEEDGFRVFGLEPSRTYYYTLLYNKKNTGIYKVLYFKNIEFIGRGENNKLLVKVHDLEEMDATLTVGVAYQYFNKEGKEISKGGSHYIGDFIWELSPSQVPSEGDYWKAFAKCSQDRVVAETPIITYVDGEWKAE